MSSYATVYLSDGRKVCAFRDGVDQLFFVLFTKAEHIELHGAEAYELTRHNYSDLEPHEAIVIGYRTRVDVVRDRLDLMGVDINAVAAVFEDIVADEHARACSPATPAVLREVYARRAALLESMTWSHWVGQLRNRLRDGDAVTRHGGRDDYASASWLMDLWEYHDPRYRLRSLLEALPDDEVITLDLADLDDDWRAESRDPQTVARDFVAYASQGGLPPIVLVEGPFDVEVLRTAIALRRPHLVEFIKFPEFASKPEGGAASLRQTLRAFASAGIPNRVLALFDNDSAARDVTRAIDVRALPAGMGILHLPEVASLRSYPTVGPQGRTHMDVNGLAASIEMYLGNDVLAPGNVPRPVEWRGYITGVGSYQGKVSAKREVQESFRRKARTAANDPTAMDRQDWTDLDQVLDRLVTALRNLSADGEP